ncbi:MAG: hypothetical protein JO181_17065 [Solirubrobacterales bacterium]|nr:hypothetical protein [Solirubrobacterales bacterium]
MISREASTPDREETIAQGRAIRVEHATATARCGNRVELVAGAGAPYSAVQRWTDGYRRSAASGRELGKILGEREP